MTSVYIYWCTTMAYAKLPSSIANFIKYGNGVDEPNRRYNSNWGI
jgi:hypothetical protein